MRLVVMKPLVVVFAAVALAGGGGCHSNYSLVYDPGQPQPPGRYGLFAAGADEPLATHDLQEGELFGTECEEGGLRGVRKRSELVVRPKEDGVVTVRRIAVDADERYAWRRMGEREE